MQNLKFKTQKYLLILLFGIAISIFFFASSAEAVTFTSTGNPDDTLAGEPITAEAAEMTLDYTDINDNPKPTVNPAEDITVTVAPVYGFSGMNDIADQFLVVSQMITHEYYVTNEGNVSDIYTLDVLCDFGNAGSGTWTIEIKRSSNESIVGSLTTGDPSTSEAINLAEDADFGFYIEVTAPSDGAKGDRVELISTCETSSTPAGQYTGANGLTYAGTSEADDSVTDSIIKPVMVITRTSSIDAPRSDQSNFAVQTGYGGGPHDAVPGSLWTFTMLFTNEGNDTAESVVIVDKIPSSAEADGATNLAHINKTGTVGIDDYLGAGFFEVIDITPPQGDASGWTVYTTSESNPDFTYGASDWTFAVTLEPATASYPATAQTIFFDDIDPHFSAKWIKWEKSVVSSGESGTLTWGVTIR